MEIMHCGLPLSYFAQQVGETEEKVVDGQLMNDLFSEFSIEQCDKLATMLDENKFESFGRLFKQWLTEKL